jgi:hypothetical protein
VPQKPGDLLPSSPANIGILNVLVDAPVLPCCRLCQSLASQDVDVASLKIVDNQLGVGKVFILGILRSNESARSTLDPSRPHTLDPLALHRIWPDWPLVSIPLTFRLSLSLSLPLPLFLFLSSSTSVSHTSAYAKIACGEQRPGRREITVDLVTMQLINAALAAASPMVLSSITMQSSGLTIRVLAARL